MTVHPVSDPAVAQAVPPATVTVAVASALPPIMAMPSVPAVIIRPPPHMLLPAPPVLAAPAPIAEPDTDPQSEHSSFDLPMSQRVPVAAM